MRGGQITLVFKMNGYTLVKNKADYEATTGQIIKKGKEGSVHIMEKQNDIRYQSPVIEVLTFEQTDVIVSSNDGEWDDEG